VNGIGQVFVELIRENRIAIGHFPMQLYGDFGKFKNFGFEAQRIKPFFGSLIK